MRGCICHFTKWQIHPFISKETVYLRVRVFPAGHQRWNSDGEFLLRLHQLSTVQPVSSHIITSSRLVEFVIIFISVGFFVWKWTNTEHVRSLTKNFRIALIQCVSCLFSDHIEYISRLIGHDFVGIGGDYDGVSRSVYYICINIYFAIKCT